MNIIDAFKMDKKQTERHIQDVLNPFLRKYGIFPIECGVSLNVMDVSSQEKPEVIVTIRISM